MSRNEDQALELAARFRAEHDLDGRPLADLFELVHTTTGCDVLAVPAEGAEHGLSMLDPATGRIVIVVATTPHPMRQRSSLAHEFGHVLAGDLDEPSASRPGSRSPTEIRADAFARHLLLPLEALRRFEARASVGEPELAEIVQEFEVSPSLAAIQFKQAGLISAAACKRFGALRTVQLAARYGWLAQYRALAAAATQERAPQALMRRAVKGYAKGVLGLTELAAWYGQSPEELRAHLGDPAVLEPSGTVAVDPDEPLFPPGFGNGRGAS